MNRLPDSSPLMADTKHARLLQDVLAQGVMREWRAEYILEALLELKKLGASDTERAERTRIAQLHKIVKAASDLIDLYGQGLPDDEALPLLEFARNRIDRDIDGRLAKDSPKRRTHGR